MPNRSCTKQLEVSLNCFSMKKRYVVFDWINFFQSKQEEREPVVSFLNHVYALAKQCGFGDLHVEMMRDILV